MRTIILFLAVCFTLSSNSQAGVASSAARAIVRKLTGKAATTAATQTAKQLARKAAAKVTAETAEAVARRASSAATRHFARTAAGSPRFVDDFAKAYGHLASHNQRRLLMLAPELEKTGCAAAVVTRIGNGSADQIIETLWKHRGKLASAAAVTALVVHGDDVAAAGGEFVTKPLIDGTMDHVVGPASRIVVSAVVLAALVTLAAALYWQGVPPAVRLLFSKLRRQVMRIVRS